MAPPAEALAKAGGGDGNRTHVRNTTTLKHYMFSLWIYIYAASKT